MKIQSIRFKISILYTAILAVTLIFFSLYLLYKEKQILYQEEAEELLVKSQEIDEFIDLYSKISQEEKTPARLFYQLLGGKLLYDKALVNEWWERDSKALGLERDFYRIRNIKGDEILRSSNLTADVERVFNSKLPSSGNRTRFLHLDINGADYYGIYYPLRYPKSKRLNLQLVMPITYTQRVLFKWGFSIIGGIVFILLISVFVGGYLTRRVLKPVLDVTRIANNITQKNLNMKIPVKELDEEMEHLVKSFNQMIGRLGSSFSYINDFNSHVAHEMKTPLAIIKSELELAVNADNSKQEDKRVMKDVLQEVNRLIKIIKDLLLLAEYEYKLEIFKMERIDLTQLIKDVYQHSKVLAADKGIGIELAANNEALWIEGDSTHLRRIFFNLVHNAVKFTPSGGQIRISTEVIDKRVHVSIKDTGIGIAPEDQAKIFEKFYRIRSVEQEAIEGNGLGLSMARAIARAHKGDIIFNSEFKKGSTFTVSFPLL